MRCTSVTQTNNEFKMLINNNALPIIKCYLSVSFFNSVSELNCIIFDSQSLTTQAITNDK